MTRLALSLVVLAACTPEPPTWTRGPDLPEPVTNNAVAAIQHAGAIPEEQVCTLYSVTGLDDSLEYDGTHTQAWSWTTDEEGWVSMDALPGVGKIAASAVAMRDRIWVLGGYEVHEDGSETSLVSLYAWDRGLREWSLQVPLPTPIDDAVALPWQDRYIVVVSGWSTLAAVQTVQIYDDSRDEWLQGTPFPGSAVFGHAGAISGDEIVIIDGVVTTADGFELVNQAWHGRLDPEDPTTITWTDLGAHPGPARYRAAAGAWSETELLFHGGTDAPYNYDGLAYDGGAPAPPLGTTLRYELTEGVFSVDELTKTPTMDHRALVPCLGAMYVIGGMQAGPTVSASTWVLAEP